MSGIVGLWNLDERPVEHAVLGRLSATLAHRGPDGEGVHIKGSLGLACQISRVTPHATTETQPLVHVSGDVLVFDGRLDNRDELLKILKDSPEVSADSSDPALILCAYQLLGDRLPEYLNGDFSLGLYEHSRSQLLLVRDAIGIRPLYYCQIGNAFVFASEIKAILAHPDASPRPNDVVLAEFIFRYLAGHTEVAETFFAGVFSVLPAHAVIVTPRGITTRRYWDFDATCQIRLGSFPEYAEAFRHHFEQAVRRRLRSGHKVAVSVSGGLDSSAIFCLGQAIRRGSPDCCPPLHGLSYTFPDGTPADEKGFLREIERAYGAEIERVPIPSGQSTEDCLDQVWHAESPLIDAQWNRADALLCQAKKSGARVLLSGHWGDQMLFDQAYLLDRFRRFAWGELRAHLKEYRRWLPDVDPKHFRRRFLGDLVRFAVPARFFPFLQRLKASLVGGRLNKEWYTREFRKRAWRATSTHNCRERHFATAHAKSLYTEARSRYHVLCMEWTNKTAAKYGLEVAFPFLDRDLVAFLMAVPGEMQTWKGRHKALLRKGMQDILPAAIAERRSKADFTDEINDGLQKGHSSITQRLQASRMDLGIGYVNDAAFAVDLAALKRRVPASGCALTRKMMDLTGMAFWLDTFFSETKSTLVRSKTTHGTTGFEA